MMRTRSITVTVAFMLLGVAAVGVADAATEDKDATVAVGAVWNRKGTIDPAGEPVLVLRTGTKQDPRTLVYNVTSKHNRIRSAMIDFTVTCEDGFGPWGIGPQAFGLPFEWTEAIGTAGPGHGRCHVYIEVTPWDDGNGQIFGKLRAKIQAAY